MKKILLSVLTVAVVAGVAFGATRAFFSDTETSTGNVLAAGEIDLKIDNTCYYNDKACVAGVWEGTNTPCDCTWELKDLEEGDTFFDLRDLKPGDWEEDTISLHAGSNDAWACVNINITEDADVTCTEPESEDGDPQCPSPTGTGGVGELSQNLNFIFWADDGDNVLEEGERVLTEGPASNVLNDVSWTIADSSGSIFDEEGGPLVGGATYYIGKAFCFGTLTKDPVEEGNNSPTDDPGIDCDGSLVNNQAQTDKLVADISFSAVQARNNLDFTCQQQPQ